MHAANISLRKNIWKLYAIQALTQALFFIPIIVLFWQSHGLTLRENFLLQVGFATTILVLEIPTGYIADRWGRKHSLVLAGCFDVLAFVVYASGAGVWHFLVAEIIIAVGVSLRSGAIEAITYDTLLELKEEKTYRRVAAHQNFLEFNTEAIAGLIGGAAAMISLVLPLWLMTIPTSIALILATTLKEPARHKMHEERHWKEIWNVTTHTLVRHKGLRSLTVLYALISTMTLTFFWFFQPYQTLVGVPLALFGVTHAVIVAAGAFAGKTLPWLEKKMDDRMLLILIGYAVTFGYLILGLTPAVPLLAAFLVSRFAWGLLGPLTSDMMNRMTTSNVRATVLSIRSFFWRVIFVATSPFVGALADATTVPYALFVAGLVGGLVLLIAFGAMRHAWKEIPA